MSILHPRSALEDIAWPPIPTPSGAALFSVLFSLERSQWWDEATIAQHQQAQLLRLLRFASAQVPYYRNLLANFDAETFDPGQWAEVPLLSRELLQSNYNELRSENLPAGHGRSKPRSTSGSTGKPVTVDWSDVSELFWHALVQRDHLWHARKLSGRLASIRHIKFKMPDPSADPSKGIEMDNWGGVVSQCFDTGPANVMSVHNPVQEQVSWLSSLNADYLQTYPSNLKQLIEFYTSNNLTAPQFRAVRTISECLDPALRDACRTVFNAPIQDLYSTTEVGYIAIQCPQFDHYHVQSEMHLVEVLDEQGSVCAPGEIGRVVVTPLHNFAMPLIRYDIGDYAEVGEPCPCGRGLPVLKRILGRSRNLLTYPDGRTDWPVFNDTSFRKVAPVSQFQIIQHTLDELELKLVVEHPLSPDQEQALVSILLSRLGYPFNCRITYLDAIPRSSSGKYEDFLSLVNDKREQ